MTYLVESMRRLAYKHNLLQVRAPDIAAKAKPGQFIIAIIREGGERIPLTICDLDKGAGTVSFAFHEVGRTTKELGTLGPGDALLNVTGPLGNPSEIRHFGRVLCVGGSIMAAPMLMQARAMREAGNRLTIVLGCRSKEFLFMEDEARSISDEVIVASDDGSVGESGLGFLQEMLQRRRFDRCLAMGPVVMMREVSEMTRPYGIPTMVSLTPVMIDGMGMCGACRVTVAGRTQFGCLDGPEFDGHQTNFDELVKRQRALLPEERLSSIAWDTGGHSP